VGSTPWLQPHDQNIVSSGVDLQRNLVVQVEGGVSSFRLHAAKSYNMAYKRQFTQKIFLKQYLGVFVFDAFGTLPSEKIAYYQAYSDVLYKDP
jgi:hypothetical protein